MKTYQTFWKQGNKKGTYKTKSLTDYHKAIHEYKGTDYARTIETDSSIEWPFGLYTEIIAITDRNKPSNNKSFTNS